MGITVREKEHWRNRIARRIDLAMEELQAKNDPGYYKRIYEQAEEEAWKSLDLHSLNQESKEIEEKIELLKKRQEVVAGEMFSRVTGKCFRQGDSLYSASLQVESSVRRRMVVHQTELMQKDKLGIEILRMQREKEELLDTVWLATSTKHIKELWTAVTSALQQESTELQKKALDIDPVADET